MNLVLDVHETSSTHCGTTTRVADLGVNCTKLLLSSTNNCNITVNRACRHSLPSLLVLVPFQLSVRIHSERFLSLQCSDLHGREYLECLAEHE